MGFIGCRYEDPYTHGLPPLRRLRNTVSLVRMEVGERPRLAGRQLGGLLLSNYGVHDGLTKLEYEIETNELYCLVHYNTRSAYQPATPLLYHRHNAL